MQSDLTQAELMAAFNAKRAELTSQGLGEALGLSKGLVRLIGAGHHPNPQPHLLAFARHFAIGGLYCPYKQAMLNLDECQARATAPRPFGGAAKTAWWEACQRCEHKPETKESEK